MKPKVSSSPELALIERHKPLVNPLKNAGSSPQAGVNPIFDNRVAISVSEAAFALGVSVRTVERMIQRNELRARRLGKRILIPKNELEAWLNRKE